MGSWKDVGINGIRKKQKDTQCQNIEVADIETEYHGMRVRKTEENDTFDFEKYNKRFFPS